MDMDKYILFGYDKDADVYEVLCGSADLERLSEIAGIVAVSAARAELRRRANDEPFDWFVIRDEAGNDLLLFVPGDPAGRPLGNKGN